MLNAIFSKLLIIIGLLGLSACAIINGQPVVVVPLNEAPETKVLILDSKGTVILESRTPAIATMAANDKYLRKEKYSIIFQTPGHIERSFAINSSSQGTYFGDIPNLKPMGVLVLNSKTGALFQIDKATLPANQTVQIPTEQRNDFEIYTVKQLPSEWKSLLYPLN